jgi:hypothetical protein
MDLKIKIHSDKVYGMRKLVIDRNNSFVIQIKDRKRTDSSRKTLCLIWEPASKMGRFIHLIIFKIIMMIKNIYLTYAIFVLLIISVFCVDCVQQSAQQLPNQVPKLSIRYHYSTEGSFYDVQIVGSKITFIHTDYEKLKEKCAQWIRQFPCWTSEDLITEEAQLTNREITDLKNLIEETKIMQLENYYGPLQRERCYPYTLKIDEKEIIYCSRPDGPPQPEAFAKVTAKIQEIVTQKFME